MTYKRVLRHVVLGWVVLWYISGCVPSQPAARTLAEGENLLLEQLRERLAEVKPTVATYLGISEHAIQSFQPKGVSPLSYDVARDAGLDQSRVLSLRPTRLAERTYTWRGTALFRVSLFEGRHCEVECFYDPVRQQWLVDQIFVREPIVNERGEPATFLRPVEPASGWKAMGC